MLASVMSAPKCSSIKKQCCCTALLRCAVSDCENVPSLSQSSIPQHGLPQAVRLLYESVSKKPLIAELPLCHKPLQSHCLSLSELFLHSGSRHLTPLDDRNHLEFELWHLCVCSVTKSCLCGLGVRVKLELIPARTGTRKQGEGTEVVSSSTHSRLSGESAEHLTVFLRACLWRSTNNTAQAN